MTLRLIDAFHGTSHDAALSILQNGYNESSSISEWLGHGVYFFVDGISDPAANAKEWAIAQAWDKKRRENTYSRFSVLRTKISADEDRLIDLTDLDGLRMFNETKEKLFSKIFSNFKVGHGTQAEHSCIMFNYLVRFYEACAVKHHLYIKSIRERKLQLQLNVPNTTVLCVKKDFVGTEIEEVLSGEIK